ncbi:hypothetical protein CPLU01_11080 [Colletotrichum plurivorum]|uniref:NAD-dependent epimerase/dehydratase domain-containing protein n=1 Tax=Colletotrichum plurivorum TaxID=2175906 RepID=A0A8H6N890_9PEZI|nr:hypothetical protein CPLU01_11080 [Colletotrichum plurivorum]
MRKYLPTWAALEYTSEVSVHLQHHVFFDYVYSSGSWILVTGASGFLVSHICLQFIERGYKVRASVRDPAQSSWLREGRFEPYANTGAIELVSVTHLGADGAYDDEIKGVSGIIHTAFVTNIVPDPSEVITPMVAAIRSITNAAIRESSVKVVVFTGSAITSKKEVWRFVEQGDLPFNVNVMSLGGIIGELLHKKHVNGPAGWAPDTTNA